MNTVAKPAFIPHCREKEVLREGLNYSYTSTPVCFPIPETYIISALFVYSVGRLGTCDKETFFHGAEKDNSCFLKGSLAKNSGNIGCCYILDLYTGIQGIKRLDSKEWPSYTKGTVFEMKINETIKRMN